MLLLFISLGFPCSDPLSGGNPLSGRAASFQYWSLSIFLDPGLAPLMNFIFGNYFSRPALNSIKYHHLYPSFIIHYTLINDISFWLVRGICWITEAWRLNHFHNKFGSEDIRLFLGLWLMCRDCGSDFFSTTTESAFHSGFSTFFLTWTFVPQKVVTKRVIEMKFLGGLTLYWALGLWRNLEKGLDLCAS